MEERLWDLIGQNVIVVLHPDTRTVVGRLGNEIGAGFHNREFFVKEDGRYHYFTSGEVKEIEVV